MIFASFAILSVLTGVVADKMASAAEEHEKEVEEAETKKKEDFLHKFLRNVFERFTPNSPYMTAKNYQALLDDYNCCEELCEILGMERDELAAAWEGFPKDVRQQSYGAPPQEVVTQEAFSEALMKAHGAVDLLSVTRVYQKLARIEKALRV
mmetsp:Transcript_42176/g.75633  ORF Transcript_42176/g.75633 Transcript_42176/m.75633 type:complete len:152 (+) Transcript_42176:3-458(+)